MPYKKKTAKKNKRVLSENLREYLLTGEQKMKGDIELFNLQKSPSRMKAVWNAVKGGILAEFIKKNPCSRPYGFWLLDAPERRRKTGGSGDGWSLGMAIDSEGLPKYWQLDWNKENPPTFESKAAYLDRHGLLSPMEKAYLEKHPRLLDPERVELEKSS